MRPVFIPRQIERFLNEARLTVKSKRKPGAIARARFNGDSKLVQIPTVTATPARSSQTQSAETPQPSPLE